MSEPVLRDRFGVVLVPGCVLGTNQDGRMRVDSIIGDRVHGPTGSLLWCEDHRAKWGVTESPCYAGGERPQEADVVERTGMPDAKRLVVDGFQPPGWLLVRAEAGGPPGAAPCVELRLRERPTTILRYQSGEAPMVGDVTENPTFRESHATVTAVHGGDVFAIGRGIDPETRALHPRLRRLVRRAPGPYATGEEPDVGDAVRWGSGTYAVAEFVTGPSVDQTLVSITNGSCPRIVAPGELALVARAEFSTRKASAPDAPEPVPAADPETPDPNAARQAAEDAFRVENAVLTAAAVAAAREVTPGARIVTDYSIPRRQHVVEVDFGAGLPPWRLALPAGADAPQVRRKVLDWAAAEQGILGERAMRDAARRRGCS